MNKIERKLKDFENSHRELNRLALKAYVALRRMLLESETMPEDVLVSIAKRVKPLIRVDKQNRKLKGFSEDGELVWLQPHDITDSFYYSFDSDTVVCDGDKNLPVEGLEKVSEFVCYHRHGNYHGCPSPKVSEVIQQMPKYLLQDENAQYAFELDFLSSDCYSLYDVVLDRHVSSVIVYKVTNGFPEKVRNQKVIFKGKEF